MDFTLPSRSTRSRAALRAARCRHKGMMWRSTNPDGTLAYDFIQTVVVSHVPYVVRALGGGLYVAGMVVMAYNCYKTIKMPSLPKELADSATDASVDNAVAVKV